MSTSVEFASSHERERLLVEGIKATEDVNCLLSMLKEVKLENDKIKEIHEGDLRLISKLVA